MAANFDSVSIVNLNKDVPESFVFDVALGQIYEIDANYDAPPLDLRGLDLEQKLEPQTIERSEIFCNNEGQKYCELILAWDENSTGEFTAVRISDALYGIVANNLIAELVE